ncbi:MAG: DUF2231 domain-containing protein [Planctomycetota bacterium]|jgi:uncharacterized membrane protein
MVLLLTSLLHAQSAGDASGAQSVCPVFTDEPVDPNISIRYRGERVFFCCKNCEDRFWANPERFLPSLPQFGGLPVESAPEHGAPEQRAAESHEHDDRGRASVGWRRWIAFAGRFHVVSIHFPIAMLLTAAFFELLGRARRSGGLESVVRALVHFGAAAGVVAVLLGLVHSMGSGYRGAAATLFHWHRTLGFSTAAAALLAAALIERRHQSRSHTSDSLVTVVLVLTAALVGVTGHLGGALVFGGEYLIP